MFFRTIRSDSFAPIWRGLSLMAGIGAIASMPALNAAISSPSATVQLPSIEASAARKPPTRTASAALWTDMRLGSEDGVYYIEYDWKPRNKTRAMR
jgi:hypothetical protein